MDIKNKDLNIITVLLITPFIIYFYKLFPETNVVHITNWVFEINVSLDLRFLAWVFLTKLSTLILLLTWYYTTSRWWRLAILVPIIIEIFKILNLLNMNIDFIDDKEYVNSLPLTFPIILALIYLATQVNYYTLYRKLLLKMESDYHNVMTKIVKKNEIEIINIRNCLSKLKEEKKNISDDKYLEKLIKLREDLLKL
ncbi:MAG: hypothetical protein HKN00_12525 [Flavobacteriaceae bacterium]|nr:hypothetical protein [Flavobacteriaceae bacterium]